MAIQNKNRPALRRNFKPRPRVTPQAIVKERIDTVRKKGIYLLPNLFTLSSLFSGFYAVVIAMAGDFEKAAIAIFVSMILDGCDGRVARLTHTQSSFGEQFDSLADMCAFGMAPAMVVYQWALHDLGRLGWAAAFVYCAGAALRLARFNTYIGVVDKSFFQGLPSPAAAALVAGFVWLAVDQRMPVNSDWLPWACHGYYGLCGSDHGLQRAVLFRQELPLRQECSFLGSDRRRDSALYPVDGSGLDGLYPLLPVCAFRFCLSVLSLVHRTAQPGYSSAFRH